MARQIDNILQKEMSRKEFLATLGFGLATVLGFSGAIKMLTGKSLGSRLGSHQSVGYGAGAYGGSKKGS